MNKLLCIGYIKYLDIKILRDCRSHCGYVGSNPAQVFYQPADSRGLHPEMLATVT